MRALLLALTLFVTPAHAERLDWREFRNDKFGLALRIPADVFSRHRASDTGDGDLFTTPGGDAKLLVGVLENVDGHSPGTYQRFIAKSSYPGLRVDYAPVGGSWTVLSGTQGPRIIYEKVMFSCGGRVINSFAMIYPIAERAFYDPIVEAVEDSFRPGTESCRGHATRD